MKGSAGQESLEGSLDTIAVEFNRCGFGLVADELNFESARAAGPVFHAVVR